MREILSSENASKINGNKGLIPESRRVLQPENGSATIAKRAIERLRFIDRVANGRMGWKEVEERFYRLTATAPGPVPVVDRSGFAYCIGIKETPGFVEGLITTLKGQRDQNFRASKVELYEYWCRITDPNFPSRIRFFFDLCDKNMEGEITEVEIKQVILLCASANKLSLTEEEGEEYARLIMEELDVEKRGFIKLIAGGIVIGVILHGGTHLACDFPRIAHADRIVFQRTIAANFQHRQPSYIEIMSTTEVATGISMVIIMAVAFSLAMHLPRRHPTSLPWPIQRLTGFNAFWYTHHMFIIVYALLIVHSMYLFLATDLTEKTTWMYIAVPVLLYAAERIVRAKRASFYNLKVLEANIYPGKVLSLKLGKPAGFNYRSGMHIFIQCPQISSFEWHPFSLTTAPDDDHLSVHIRALGDWSYQIYNLFQEALVSENFDFPKIYIDGPYGAAAQDHIKYDIVVLIGLGIGATPFISVLKDIVHALQKLQSISTDEIESGTIKGPSKAYFYWVTREQSSLDCFRDVMEEISNTNQTQAVIEMHNYLTSVCQEGDERSALRTALQPLHHSKNGLDLISRTPVQTHFARPNWFNVLSSLARRHGGATIGVFFCGPLVLARELESLCNKITTKTTTRFVFHKENF